MPMAKPILVVYDTMSTLEVRGDTIRQSQPKGADFTYIAKRTPLGNTKYAYDEIWGRNMAKNRINYTVDFVDRPHTNGALVSARYIRIKAKCLKKLPPSHLGAGNPAWLFLDEVVVK
jgi:hypothetical protein